MRALTPHIGAHVAARRRHAARRERRARAATGDGPPEGERLVRRAGPGARVRRGRARAARRCSRRAAADERRGLPARPPELAACRRPRARAGCRRRARARCAWSAGCSSRAPTPTARSRPRRPGSSRATGRSRWRSPTGPCSGARRSTTSPRRLTGRPLERLDPPVLAALRLGLFELLFLGGVADHAAVNESVELVKQLEPRGRRARQRGAATGGAGGPGRCSRRSTTPRRRARRCSTRCRSGWPSSGGASSAPRRRERCSRGDQRAGGVGAAGQHARGHGGGGRGRAAGAEPSGARTCRRGSCSRAPFDAQGSELWAAGAIMPQSRASMLVVAHARRRAGRAGARSVRGPRRQDHASGRADREPRARSSRSSAIRAGPRRSSGRWRGCGPRACGSRSATRATARTDGPFDRVLVDPPCSGLGTLQSRPGSALARDAPRRSASSPRSRPGSSRPGRGPLAPGGALVYSVCTISRAESEDVVDGVPDASTATSARERRRPAAAAPDGTDGFFIARLRRA